MNKILSWLVLFTIGIAINAHALVNRTLNVSKGVNDYGPVILNMMKEMAQSGGGTIKFGPGVFPVLTPVDFQNQKDVLSFSFIGSGQNATILQDTRTSAQPHTFLKLTGAFYKPLMTLKVSDLSIVGNNVPYGPSHPFFGSKGTAYSFAIIGQNLKTAGITNVTIKNFYGTGIMLGNSDANKDNAKLRRMESPVISKVSIINTWAQNNRDDSGDGIMLWYVNKPTVQYCNISNSLNQSKYPGRCGIVLEFGTEKAVIKNNTIEGYSRNIHIESTYGGHIIENNTLAQSYIGITLNEGTSLPPSRKSLFSPTTIRNNTFKYNDDYQKNKLELTDFGFISIHNKTFVLDGLTISGNKFIAAGASLPLIKTTKKQYNSKKVYFQLQDQTNINMKNNTIQ